jgi:hypothetical protein
VAHIYNRLYQGTGDAKLREAARYWFVRTLDMRDQVSGVAGYLLRGINDQGETGWVRDGSFLTGVSGIGLALLAAITEQEPEWDRLLLLSEPRSRRFREPRLPDRPGIGELRPGEKRATQSQG